MTRPAAGILLEIRQRAIEVTVADGRIRLKAPAGQKIPRTLQQAVAANKPDVLAAIATAPWFVEAPLSVFAQCKVAIEVHVPGLADTLWFASDAAQVDRLLQDGVRRGRIWDADELAKLWQCGPPSHERVLAVARAKLWSNSVVIEVGKEPPAAAKTSDPTQGSLDLSIPRPGELD